MSHSSLVNYIKLSPNASFPRQGDISYITIHCMGSEHTAEELGEIFASPLRKASSNYGIDKDGTVGLYVEEQNRSWCTGGLDKSGIPICVNGISGADNDQCAITIEVACTKEKPYIVSEKSLEKTIILCADICKRYGKDKLIWVPDKEIAMKYSPLKSEIQLTVHRWFSEKECPGDYLLSKHSFIAKTVTSMI